jgi:hypothetical protein
MSKNIVSMVLFLLIMFSNAVNAVTCSDSGSGVFDSETDLDSIAAACLDANTNNDSEYALNSGDFFGISSWTLLAKVDGGQSDDLIDLDVDSTGNVSGTFSFDSSIWSDNDEIIVVLKGGVTGSDGVVASYGKKARSYGKKANRKNAGKGNKPAKGVKWSAYLLEQDISEGFWIYGHGRQGQLKDLSHLTIYGSGMAVVPVPAAMWLFGSGLLALVAVSRRRLR